MTTAHHVVDERFARFIADDLGITVEQALEAFEGEPQKTAAMMVGYVWDQEEKSRQEKGVERTMREFSSARIVKNWARKHKRGGWRESA